MTVYNTRDEVVKYTLRDRLFGPKFTGQDYENLETRAVLEGWHEWYYMIIQMDNKRKRRWLLAYLRDDIITVTAISFVNPVYEDDDPYEGMG